MAENPRICFELLPPGRDSSVLPPGNLVPSPLGSGPAHLALDKNVFWRNGRKLRVKFLGGDSFLHDKVKQYAQQWEKYANLDFVFVNSGDAEIRIDFITGGGSWSHLGTTNLQIPQNEQTMNFGWFDHETEDDEFSRVTIHEFGHALGCLHEHMSPAANIPWDKPKVYASLMGPPNNWTKEMVDRNLFNKYPPGGAVYTRFDPLSIMIYEIPDDWTIGSLSYPRTRKLSELDKSFIRQVYPPRNRSIGSFTTHELRTWDKPSILNAKQLEFVPPYNEAPSIAIGLNELDISKDANIRINAYADRITESDFLVHVDSWADTIVYSGGATWHEVAASDSDFQVGEFNTLVDRPWNDPKPQNSKRIIFERSFPAPPTVIVWLKGVDMHKNKNWRITAYASDITNESFRLNIDTWGDTVLYSAAASWIAFPSNKDRLLGGFGDSSMYRREEPAQQENGGYVNFPEGMFDQAPKVLVGIKSFNFGNQENLRLRVKAEEVTNAGFRWSAKSWADSVCYGSGVSYLVY
jgi:hypothetical protein